MQPSRSRLHRVLQICTVAALPPAVAVAVVITVAVVCRVSTSCCGMKYVLRRADTIGEGSAVQSKQYF
jgi:hypothetical protein